MFAHFICQERPRNSIEQAINIFNIAKEESFETYDFQIDERNPIITNQLKELLQEFKHLFAFKLDDIKGANGIVHRIDTGDNPPIKQRNYRYGHFDQKEISNQVKDMLKAGVIRPSCSPWNNPIVLVRRDNKARLCIDFRKLNAITKIDVYPLPHIEDLVDRLSGNPIMSIFDLKSGFWQIPMAEDDRAKTSFTADNNTFEFLYMPFGLVNAPSTFQRVMNTVFRDILNQNVGIYIDDVIVYSRDAEEHLLHLRQVFERLDARDLRLHPQKCKFMCEELKFLGFIISKDGIKPDPKRTEAIRNFPIPTKVKDIRSFIGMANFYRKYIKDFASIASPLTGLIRKDIKFNFTEECKNAFNFIKEKLSSEPILAHFRIGDRLILYSDGSGYGIGAILNQIQDGKEVTLQYASATLNKHQENYTVTQRECLAIIFAIDKWRPYLMGVPFTLKVDHCALCYLMGICDPYGKLARWALKIQEYQIKIEYKSGKTHGNVDCLSRYPLKERPPVDLEELDMYFSSPVDIKGDQMKDPWIKDIKRRLAENKLSQHERYILINDILYRKCYDTHGIERTLLCVPNSLKQETFDSLHKSPMGGGHNGFIKTWYKFKERFYFPNIEKWLRIKIQSCKECQERKKEPGLPKGDNQPIIADGPYQIIGMDIVDAGTTTRKTKYRHILVFIDYFTKYLEAVPIKDMTSESVADAFINSILLRHGAVHKIITDRGQNFCSKFSEAVYEALRSKHVRTSPYHPETNGLAESQCKEIINMLAHYVNDYQDDWDKWLNFVIWNHNTAINTETKFSPYNIIYGRDPRFPIDLIFGVPTDYKMIEEQAEKFKETRALVKYFISEGKRKQTLKFNEKHRQVQYDVGDRVMVRIKDPKEGVGRKMMKNNYGPLEIIHKIPPNTYLLLDKETGRRKRAHIKNLQLYYDPIPDEELWPTPTLEKDKGMRTLSSEFGPSKEWSEEPPEDLRPTLEDIAKY